MKIKSKNLNYNFNFNFLYIINKFIVKMKVFKR